MRKTCFAVGWLVAAVAVGGCAPSPAPPTSEPPKPSSSATPSYSDGLPANKTADAADRAALVQGNTAFALELYRELAKEDGNLFFSPYSLSTALALSYAGAKGETAAQMAGALKFRLPSEQLHPAFAALIHDLHGEQRDAGCRLLLANALWRQKGFELREEYLRTVRDNYGGVLKEAEFKGNPAAARQAINAWVGEKTSGTIKDLIPPDLISDQTRVVLTNAILFQGKWAKRFEKGATREMPFHLAPGRKAKAMLMFCKDHFRYFDGTDFQALEMPYQGGKTSLVVLLPSKVEGLAGLERNLTAEKLQTWLRKMEKEEVEVLLPRFTMASTFRLKPDLTRLGMVNAFDPMNADFSRIAGPDQPLFLTDAVHKAFIDVNEEGTTAAGGTALPDALFNGVPHFHADHPFLFLIRDIRTDAILFIGRVMDPRG